MHLPGLHNTTKQLALLLVGFIVVICLLESAGLRTWANRLEVGRSREFALRVTSAIDDKLKPLGLSNIRQLAIDKLAEHGWNESKIEQEGVALANQQPIPEAASAPLAVISPIVVASAPLNSRATFAKRNLASSTMSAGIKIVPVNVLPLLTKDNELIALPKANIAQPRLVALAGDSMMAVGLSVQLQRDLAKHKSIKLLRAFKSGTGLARPEVFNWNTEYPKMLGGQNPAVVICAMGANDGQGFVENGKVLAFATAEWIAVYRARVKAYLDMLTKNGAVVLWVKLPPMKSEKFAKKIKLINSIEQSVVQKNARAIWWNPAPYLADEDGNFRELAPVGASQRIARIRSADGIHMLEAGASLFTPRLVAWLNPS